MLSRRAQEVGDFRLLSGLYRVDMRGRLSIGGRSGLVFDYSPPSGRHLLGSQAAGTYWAPIGRSNARTPARMRCYLNTGCHDETGQQ